MLTNNNKFLIYNNKTQNEQKICECRQAIRYFFFKLIQRAKWILWRIFTYQNSERVCIKKSICFVIQICKRNFSVCQFLPTVQSLYVCAWLFTQWNFFGRILPWRKKLNHFRIFAFPFTSLPYLFWKQKIQLKFPITLVYVYAITNIHIKRALNWFGQTVGNVE